MNPFILILFIAGASSFLTWWLLLGLLNPYIDAILGILKCAFGVLLNFLADGIFKLVFLINRILVKPIRKMIQKIHIPTVIKGVIFLALGISIFALDHFYATKIYAEDQTTFYDFIIFGKKYWVTQVALMYGGIFIFLASLYFLKVILQLLNKMLDHPLDISIVFYK